MATYSIYNKTQRQTTGFRLCWEAMFNLNEDCADIIIGRGKLSAAPTAIVRNNTVHGTLTVEDNAVAVGIVVPQDVHIHVCKNTHVYNLKASADVVIGPDSYCCNLNISNDKRVYITGVLQDSTLNVSRSRTYKLEDMYISHSIVQLYNSKIGKGLTITKIQATIIHAEVGDRLLLIPHSKIASSKTPDIIIQGTDGMHNTILGDDCIVVGPAYLIACNKDSYIHAGNRVRIWGGPNIDNDMANDRQHRDAVLHKLVHKLSLSSDSLLYIDVDKSSNWSNNYPPIKITAGRGATCYYDIPYHASEVSSQIVINIPDGSWGILR